MLRTRKTAAEGAPATDASVRDYSAHFEANPTEDKLFVTSDGEVFTETNKGWAKSHAKSLEDKIIKEVSRDEDDADEAEDVEEQEPNA
jgi:hypothetical protein